MQLDSQVAEPCRIREYNQARGNHHCQRPDQTKAIRTAPSTLAAPEALSATAGDHEGEIKLGWRKVENSRRWIIQISPDPPNVDSWGHAETVTVAHKTPSRFLPNGDAVFCALWLCRRQRWATFKLSPSEDVQAVRIRQPLITLTNRLEVVEWRADGELSL